MNTFSWSTLKMLLFCIVKFGPTAQICAKTPKFETPFSLFSRTHARGLLMAHSTRFFPPIFNRVNEASLRSPDHVSETNQCNNVVSSTLQNVAENFWKFSRAFKVPPELWMCSEYFQIVFYRRFKDLRSLYFRATCEEWRRNLMVTTSDPLLYSPRA